MGRERYVIEAIFREGRSHRDVAAAAGVSKAWVTKLVARYREYGELALEPRSRRPKSCAHATAAELQDAVLALRRELDAAGHDAGPHTINHHLSLTRSDAPSVATIWRILKRHGEVTPQPQKRPKSSFIRFQADLPNEMWQSDFTHGQLADGTGVEILNYLDDHSRFALACDAFFTVKGLDVVNSFHIAAHANGFPASLLTDNGAVSTGRTRKGKVLLESELNGSASSTRTHAPITPRPAARWSASTRPSSAISSNNRPRHHWPLSSSSSTPSAPTTTTTDRTERSTVRRRSWPSTLVGIGRYYIGARITLLVAGPHIRVVDEDGRIIRDSRSIPRATTRHSAHPPGDQKSGTMSRDRWAPSPETSHGWGGRIRTFEWRIQSPLPYHLATPQGHDDPNRGRPHTRTFARLRPRTRPPASPLAQPHAAATIRRSPRETRREPRASGCAPPRQTRGTPSPAAWTQRAAPTRP